MNKIKRLLSCLCAVAIMLTATISVGSADTGPFTDVESNDWFAENVAACYGYGIVSGTSVTTFEPDRSISRAEFVTMLYRLDVATKYHGILNIVTHVGYAGEEPDSLQHFMGITNAEMMNKAGESKFVDVDLDDYYGPAVIWASDNGYVTGTTETTFSPDDTITREQMMTMLYRYQYTEGLDFMYRTGTIDLVSSRAFAFDFDEFGKEVLVNVDVLANYDDGVAVSTYAKEGVAWAIQSEYVTGISATELDPAGTTTRAQVATIFARMLNNAELAATHTMYLHHLELRATKANP